MAPGGTFGRLAFSNDIMLQARLRALRKRVFRADRGRVPAGRNGTSRLRHHSARGAFPMIWIKARSMGWSQAGLVTMEDPMKTAILLTALVAFSAGSWAVAQPARGPMMDPDRDGARPWGYGMQRGDWDDMRGSGMMRPGMMRMMLVLVDTDGDGALSLEEIQAVHARMFTATDANGDGRVTPEEMEAFMHGE